MGVIPVEVRAMAHHSENKLTLQAEIQLSELVSGLGVRNVLLKDEAEE